MTSNVDLAPLYSKLVAQPDMRELVDLYVGEMPDRIQSLLDVASRRDWETLSRLAHQFKGSAGSYGFHQLTEPALRLERAAKSQTTEEKITTALEDLVAMCRRVRAGEGE